MQVWEEAEGLDCQFQGGAPLHPGSPPAQPDLGALLSWEDHQQFIGRLRRDGTAVYPR